MNKIISNYTFKAFFAGVITFVAQLQVNFIPGWFCFIPLFIVLQNENAKTCFRAGLIFGLTIGLVSFFWMIEGAERFTGRSSLYSYWVFCISAAGLSFYFGLVNYCFARLRLNSKVFSLPVLNGIIVSALYILGEFMLSKLSDHLPWFAFHSGYSLMGNLYAIQPASWFGMDGLSFICVLINFLLANILSEKKWKKFIIPTLIWLTYMLAGWYIYANLHYENNELKPVKIAILNGNISPEIKWDNNNGNQLVKKLLQLNAKAAALKPDIALWNESAIPWTYRSDDDLVKQIIQTSRLANLTNVLGINTDYKQDEVYNSAYLLLPDGTVAGRYDKRYLLSFIEQPFAGIIFPFLSSEGFKVKAGEGQHALPLQTAFGKAGVMICNEATVPRAAASMAENGAVFLVNLSNDGWFSNTYITTLHLYNVRMRAVETRKDIAVNSNLGYSGLVKASGEMDDTAQTEDAYVRLVEIQPHTNNTLFLQAQYILLSLSVLVTGLAIIHKIWPVKKG